MLLPTTGAKGKSEKNIPKVPYFQISFFFCSFSELTQFLFFFFKNCYQ